MSSWKLMEQTISYPERTRLAKFILTTDKFTSGSKVMEFEKAWSEWLGCRYSLFVSSGSTANLLLVAAIKEKYKLNVGDKVLVPACTWMTNVAPIIQLGLTPIFCDVNLENFSYDVEDLKKISENHPDIKMIFVTHLLGFPAENNIYREIFPDSLIIDDVCESHGAKFTDGSKVGSDSLGATFSFYFGHHMTTIEGGMVSTNDKDLYDLMKMKRSHGLARESIRFDDYAKEYAEIDKSFLFITDGYNFRNHEISAVLGISQLKKLNNSIKKRKDNYNYFYEILNRYSELFYIPSNLDGNSSFCFPVISRSRDVHLNLKNELRKAGIEYRPVVGGNLLAHPFLSNYSIGYDKDRYNVEILQDQGLYIGNHQFLNKRKIKILDKIFYRLGDKSNE